MHPTAPAAIRLAKRLAQDPPVLGVFLPAGFPAPGLDAETLKALTLAGADVLEIGVPYSRAPLDGPAITEANRRSLGYGTRIDDVFTTVRRTAQTTQATVLVMSYWEPVRSYGVGRFAEGLALSGAAGALIPDIPATEAGPWSAAAAAAAAGLHNFQFAARNSSDAELTGTVAHASGWMYAPATARCTGYQGPLDVPALQTFTQRLRALSDVPVVTGVGVSAPSLAAQVAPFVDGVVIGSPIVRDLLFRPDRSGIAAASSTTALFAESLRTPALA
ncbi:tryptophan synthase subunit alpha [Streptomyces sp. NPDC054865]